MTNSETSWEPIDRRRMSGVFDAIGYSSDPIALFRDDQAAEEWLAWDAAKGDDRAVCCETCIIPVDVSGRVWNSIEPCTDPVPSSSTMSDYERGRRDAIRDAIAYLMTEVRPQFCESEPEHRFIKRQCTHLEKFTAVKPDGRGTEWP